MKGSFQTPAKIARRGPYCGLAADLLIRRSLACVLLGALPGAAPAQEHVAPEAVSPGSSERYAPVSQPCPAFSWTAVEEALGYELAVYDVAASEGLGSPVLETALPAGATSWTPSADLCMARGAQYAWSVRSRGPVSGSPWSEPSFFQVLRGPTEEEFLQALDTVNEYLRGRGAAPQGAQEPETRAASDTEPGPTGLSPDVVTKAIAADAAAIRGELDETAGASFGVLGVSNSPDGAGVAADNTAGGADVVLGGSVPALLTEAGISRSSSAGSSFDIANPVGEMALTVNGSPVFTGATDGSGSGLDADLLDGLEPAAFAPSSHVHDGRYFTEGELTTSGGGGAVHWDNLDAVPVGFADGNDDIGYNTQYSAGPGLVLTGANMPLFGGYFGVPGAAEALVPTDNHGQDLAEVGVKGVPVAITIGGSGLPLVLYADHSVSPAVVYLVNCNDLRCTSFSTAAVGRTNGLERPSITIGSDGLPVMSFVTNGLGVIHCETPDCSVRTDTFLEANPASQDTGYSSVAVGSDGLPLIAYAFGTEPTELRVAHCNDMACSSATMSTFSSPSGGASALSLSIGLDGLGLISLLRQAPSAADWHWELDVAHCADVICSSVTTIDLPSDPDPLPSAGFGETQITVGANGYGIISFYTTDYECNTDPYYSEVGNLCPAIAFCSDIECSSVSTTPLEAPAAYPGGIGGNDTPYTSLTTTPEGDPLVAYYYQELGSSIGELKIARHDALIGWTLVSAQEGTGYHNGTTIGAGGLPLIAYQAVESGPTRVRLIRCGNSSCVPHLRRR